MTLASEEREVLVAAGQEHLLEHERYLDARGRERLRSQLAGVDLVLVRELHAVTKARATPARSFEPPEVFPLVRGPTDDEHAAEAIRRGHELLRAGRVGFVLVAGGQASRLGYDAPKGAFPIGPVSGRPLFAFHAHRLLAAQARYGVATPWYVMTSPSNDAATRAFFDRHEHFGLDPGEVFFFVQDMLPALDEDGRILLSGSGELFLAPNGHGGCLLGLESSGALEDMRRRGLEQISYFQVDNPLVRPTDPLFLGLHALAGAGMSSKVVDKRNASEKVGVIGRIDGRMGCIEYSNLPAELREARDPGGTLRFRAGNIAVHALAVDFVERVTRGELDLPWHAARKTMKVVATDGTPHEVTGYKFETFVFDALAQSPTSVTMEVDRSQEFSPVKNRTGEDSPLSARRDLCGLFEGWVRAAGLEPPPPDRDGIRPIEVDPRVAETQDDFLAHGQLEPDVRPTGHLYGA